MKFDVLFKKIFFWFFFPHIQESTDRTMLDWFIAFRQLVGLLSVASVLAWTLTSMVQPSPSCRPPSTSSAPWPLWKLHRQLGNRMELNETHLMACSRWALRISGFMFRLAMMSAMVAPTIALACFTVRRVRFLVCSSSIPFLCLRRYKTVHFTLRGLRFMRKERSHFLLMKVKV